MSLYTHLMKELSLAETIALVIKRRVANEHSLEDAVIGYFGVLPEQVDAFSDASKQAFVEFIVCRELVASSDAQRNHQLASLTTFLTELKMAFLQSMGHDLEHIGAEIMKAMQKPYPVPSWLEPASKNILAKLQREGDDSLETCMEKQHEILQRDLNLLCQVVNDQKLAVMQEIESLSKQEAEPASPQNVKATIINPSTAATEKKLPDMDRPPNL